MEDAMTVKNAKNTVECPLVERLRSWRTRVARS